MKGALFWHPVAFVEPRTLSAVIFFQPDMPFMYKELDGRALAK